MKFYDVVILVAGFSGLQCAKLLSGDGAKILLVDRKTDLSKDVHTTGSFASAKWENSIRNFCGIGWNEGEEIHIGVGGYAAGFNPREALKIFKEKMAGKIIDLKIAELAETRGGRGFAADGGRTRPLFAGLSAMAANVIAERLRTGTPKILLSYWGELFRARFVSRLWMRRIIAAVSNQKLLDSDLFFCAEKSIGNLESTSFSDAVHFPMSN